MEAGLTLHQNNGLVEGKVNKLKLIKRMGYGRAGFPHLAPAGAPCPLKPSQMSSQSTRELRSLMIVPFAASRYAFGLTPELIPAFDEWGIGWLELH